MSQALLEFTGQTPGNLIAVLRDGVVIGSAVFSEDEPRPAPPDVVRAIEARSWNDARHAPKKWAAWVPTGWTARFEGSDSLIVGVSLNLADQIIARKNIDHHGLVASRADGHRGADHLGGGLYPSPAAPGRRDRRGGRRDATRRR